MGSVLGKALRRFIRQMCWNCHCQNNVCWFVRLNRGGVLILSSVWTPNKSYPNCLISPVYYEKMDQRTFCGECIGEGPSPLPQGAMDHAILLGWRKIGRHTFVYEYMNYDQMASRNIFRLKWLLCLVSRDETQQEKSVTVTNVYIIMTWKMPQQKWFC